MADPLPQKSSLRLHKTVVMVGMMGAGKTAIGKALAARLRVPFLDSDAEIERAADRAIPEIFERDGEAFFRKRETEVIQRLLAGTCCVLSTGGGAFLAAQNREMISREGVSLWLDADLELLWQRVKHRDSRPLLRTPDPKTTLEALLAERQPLYAQSDLRVSCVPNLSIEGTTDLVVTALLQRADVLERLDD